MTRPAQKDREERHVKEFLKGVTEYTALESCERPDFWIRRQAGDIALEVTEYHPRADEVPHIPRTALEARWRKELEPRLSQACSARPTLEGVKVIFRFKGPGLPPGKEHPGLVSELVTLMDLVARDTATGQDRDVVLLGQDVIAAVGECPSDEYHVAQEDWPETVKWLSSLRVSRWPVGGWLPWTCLDADTAWLGPSPSELRRVLDGKAERAQGYTLGGAPLWLLVVCETHGDLQSHIYPDTEEDLAQLGDALRATSFDFEHGPFREVWLYSEFTRRRLRLHPAGE